MFFIKVVCYYVVNGKLFVVIMIGVFFFDFVVIVILNWLKNKSFLWIFGKYELKDFSGKDFKCFCLK